MTQLQEIIDIYAKDLLNVIQKLDISPTEKIALDILVKKTVADVSIDSMERATSMCLDRMQRAFDKI